MHNPIKAIDGSSHRLTGYRVRELRLATKGTAARLVLEGPYETCLELDFEGPLTLARGATVQELTGAVPGASFDPKSLAPLAELLGHEVVAAVVDRAHVLAMEFSNRLTLTAGLDGHEYPSWTLRPRTKETL